MEKNNISEFIDNLIIIPDTNVLLYLYKCSFNGSQNIINLIGKIKDKVIIPGRVYKEYLGHKNEEQSKIDRKYENFAKDLKKRVAELKDGIERSISESRKYDFPDCDLLETNINSGVDRIIDYIVRYEGALSSEKQNKSVQIANVEQLIQYWCDNQQIKQQHSITEMLELIKEGELRYRYKMPPGYMDEKKDKEVNDTKKDNFDIRTKKYGDLFVWKEIIDIGKTANGSFLIFLTNDVKEDWWELAGEQGNKEAVCMRSELVEEYVAETGSNKIEFMTLSRFYELFSSYYAICDIKTALELDYQSYIHGIVHGDHKNEIDEYIYNNLINVDWEDISSEFFDIESPNINFDDISIDEITLHYDDDGETGFYDVKISTRTFPIYISRREQDSESLLAVLELNITIYIQIQRDLRNLDEVGISYKSFSYDVSSIKDAWEVYLEQESNNKAEAVNTLEDYYYH